MKRIDAMAYNWRKTAQKAFRDLVIYGVPIVGSMLLGALGGYADITVGAAIALIVKGVVDWAKHK